MNERGTKELKQLKHLSLKIQEATPKNIVITEKKNNLSDKSFLPTRDIYLQTLPLILSLQMNYSFNKMFHLTKIFFLMIGKK